ncbi:LCP family protein [Nocardioides sp. MAHUQ-72]|uniref:LCP family protein n=1 Tax=unclassified Nocardioides TaxID=2615069 RepID=UPI00361EDE49
MADRPRGKDRPDDGSPEFNWLYGGKGSNGDDDATRAVPRQPRPEETRVMPTVPRPGSTSRPPSAPPPPRPPAPSRGPSRRPRRPRFRARWLLVLLLLWVVWLVAVPLFAWSKVDKVEFEPSGDRPDDQPGTTYLMVGSDSRAGLSPEERKALGTGNASGQRTDTIMLLHTGSGPNLLMSIPRDSLVDIPGHGTTKINAAFAFGGPKLLVKTVENATGIRIDDYVEIGFGGVVDVVDAVGGVEICPRTDMKDKLANLDIKKGCQEVDGATALGYARSRHTDARYGDIGRAAHQREVVSAVGKKVVSPWTVINPFRYWKINMAAPDSFAFGEGTSPIRAAMWVTAMTRVNGDNGLTCGVPIADLAVHWDPERSKQMFDYIIEDKTDEIPDSLCTPTGTPR